ncbi:hypothetical protein NLO72_07150 [Pseudomonas tremae]|uniref:hypothetical protein n=1 Tax=Pseudomonas syringae group TaxID=136849 RepID=UPI0001AF456E|nr:MULTISPECIES: hypothetical protein [Pseudomonas syringae group]MCQ2989014.1 hypothetical protein [Pseudomonas tremae]MCQ3014863.1 hypothetical protein [Pseudomonas tremae]QGL56608.1 hypothetical protein POR16_09720 [Pseudomonas coronafaciens pv. oryzae str. 1_6]RMM37218.1 hypothetical protein ALQ80_00653 [Pseudomonas coronafaciens pv. oryzae]
MGMTNKPNDVRVSRELLERALACATSNNTSNWSSRLCEDLRLALAQQGDQQGEPVAITELLHIFDSNKGADRTLVISKKLAAQLLADQPATTKVVLPARLQWNGLGNAANNLKASAWNACLDEVAKLNHGQS